VCYSVAVSTVFQTYLTTYLIEPGYEEPIKTVEQMLKSEKYFGFQTAYKMLFANTSDPVQIAIVKNAVDCHNLQTCFRWATVYKNFSTIFSDVNLEFYLGGKNITDINNKPILCELENGVVRTYDFTILFTKGSPFVETIDDVVGHIVESGILVHIKKRLIYKGRLKTKFDSTSFTDTYYTINIRQLRTAFYLLMLGYVLALACFVIEIMWFRYRTRA
jgi:hypothetical protein